MSQLGTQGDPDLRAERIAAAREIIGNVARVRGYRIPSPQLLWASRVLSFMVAAAYLAWFPHPIVTLRYLLLPIATTWFPIQLANATDSFVSKPSPPIGVLILGWVLLLVPVWKALVSLALRAA